MTTHRKLILLLTPLLISITSNIAGASILSCSNNYRKESAENQSTASVTYQPYTTMNLVVTCDASVSTGEASALEIVLGASVSKSETIVKEQIPCDNLPHTITNTYYKAWDFFPRAFMLPNTIVSGSFKVGHVNMSDDVTYNFTLSDSREPTSMTIEYQPSISLKGTVSEKLSAPLINSISGNGTATLKPGLSDTAAYGILKNGENTLNYTLDNSPGWVQDQWELIAGTTYQIKVDNTKVAPGTYTGFATLTANCE